MRKFYKIKLLDTGKVLTFDSFEGACSYLIVNSVYHAEVVKWNLTN